MKLFMVADGDYSDYHVCGIYTTMKKAEEAKEYYAADYGIQEIEADAIPDHPKGMLLYEVDMEINGYVQDTRRRDCSDKPHFGAQKDYYLSDDYGVFIMWAKDEQHAVKIANEKRAQLIANNEWKGIK